MRSVRTCQLLLLSLCLVPSCAERAGEPLDGDVEHHDADGTLDGDTEHHDADAALDGGLGPLDPWPAAAVGPYPIGVTTVELLDAARADRVLPLEVWYPAVHDAAAASERYRLEVNGLTISELDSPLGAVRDATPDRSAGARPLVLFSHGSGGVRIQSLFLTEFLATHGFVVIAPDHIGNTMQDMMNETSVELSMARSALDRPRDLSFILDQISANCAEAIPLLAGMIDAERVAVVGHSFGGYTSLALSGSEIDLEAIRSRCAEDSSSWVCSMNDLLDPAEDSVSFYDARIRASIPLAPGTSAFGPESFNAIVVPTLILAGDLDRTNDLAEVQIPLFDGITATSARLAVIAGAGHFSFTNMCTIIDYVGVDLLRMFGLLDALLDGCSDENIADTDAHEITNTLVTAFLQYTLQNHEDALGFLTSGEQVEVTTNGR